MIAAASGYTRCVCIDKTCGVVFFVADHIDQQAKSVGAERWVFCPNGHKYHYTRGDLETLREDATRWQRQRDELQVALAEQKASNGRLWRLAIYWKGIAHRRKR